MVINVWKIWFLIIWVLLCFVGCKDQVLFHTTELWERLQIQKLQARRQISSIAPVSHPDLKEFSISLGKSPLECT